MNRRRIDAIRTVAICAALSVPGLAGAGNVFDKLNEVLQHLPKPSAATQSATQTATPAAPVNTAMSEQAPAASATPEGVKAIIAATPAIEAGPFYLGMPADKAVAQMKASGLTNYPDGQSPGDFMFQIRQVSGQTYVGGITGFVKDGNGIERTSVGLAFTMYPNPQVVTAITRAQWYPKDQGPTVGNTVAALRKKYGRESLTQSNTDSLYWLLDAQGHALSREQVLRYQNKCGVPGNVGIDPGWQGSKVAQGLQSSPLSARLDPLCRGITIQAAMPFHVIPVGSRANDFRNGLDSVADGVVDRLAIQIYDSALDVSAAVVSHEVAANGVNRQNQQQIDNAKKRGGPKL